MKNILRSFIACAAALFATSNVIAAQESSIRDLVLYEREFHLLVKSDGFFIVVAPNSELMPVLNDLANGSANTIGNIYNFVIIPYEGNLVPISYQVRQIIIYEGNRPEILASDLFEESIRAFGLLGLTELGDPLVESRDVSQATPKEVEAGLYFENRQFADVCTSFYIPPSASIIFQRAPVLEIDWHSAAFFISNNADSEACFQKLFLDLIGLRGLTAEPIQNPTRLREILTQLSAFDNNYIFHKLNSD